MPEANNRAAGLQRRIGTLSDILLQRSARIQAWMPATITQGAFERLAGKFAP